MTAIELFSSAEALLVDVDGTLVDSSGSVFRAWSAFAARHGLEAAEVHRFAQGRPAAETVVALAPQADHAREAALQEEAEITDTVGVVAFPGAVEILADPRPLAIVTSCSRALAEARLAAAGLSAPAVMITSDDVSAGKPDPECYRLGAARLGIDPGRCVVLEDAPAGITAGAAAGARVIAIPTTHGIAELTAADAIAASLLELVGEAQA